VRVNSIAMMGFLAQDFLLTGAVLYAKVSIFKKLSRKLDD